MSKNKRRKTRSGHQSERPQWRKRVRAALQSLGGKAPLHALYHKVEQQYPEALQRAHWKAKIRQVVQQDPNIENVEFGVWRLIDFKRQSAAKRSKRKA